MPRGTTLQSSDQIVIQITHMQVPSHLGLHESIDLNDLKLRHASQDPPWGPDAPQRRHTGQFGRPGRRAGPARPFTTMD